MSGQSTPLVPPTEPSLRGRVMLWSVGAAVRASLVVSPRPAALLVRRVFAAGGKQTAASLDKHAPTDVTVLVDQRYGEDADMLLDVVHPMSVQWRLPLLLWVHGGGFVGGSKDELIGYFKVIASRGYVVAAPQYSLAPEHRYPTPPRQVMQALDYLQGNAARLHLDPNRIVIAGDSAGAHIAAQIAAMVTTPGYAEKVGVQPTITAAQLRGLVLACGPYDLALVDSASSPAGHRFISAVLWAYSGTRRYRDEPAFAAWSITDNISPAFPPTLITVGNADPLRAHSERLADALHAAGQEPETVFWPDDRQPPLGHEYQFDLDSDAGQHFLDRLLRFLAARL
jgi:acetyl esterase